MGAHDHTYDAIVVGVGGMGSAVCYHLARENVDVLGLEKFDIPHDRGSSHGQARAVGRAFYERQAYMDLYARTYDLWEHLEETYGESLLLKTGSLTSGRPGTETVSRARRVCERFGFPHETLDPATANERFPGYDLPDSHVVVFQPNDGFVRPTAGTIAHAELAMAEGARIQAREPVLEWKAGENGVSVRTPDATYTAGSLVLTAGPWLSSLLEGVNAEMVAERRVVGRFGTEEQSRFRSPVFPVSSITTDGGRYGAHPNHGLPGVKVAGGTSTVESTDPDDVAAPGRRDEAPLRRFAERYLTGGAGPTLRLETCMYTNTPDGDPVIDRHPDQPGVYVAGGFSGHGYKFTPVIGEIMTEFVLEGETTHDIDPFRIDRF